MLQPPSSSAGDILTVSPAIAYSGVVANAAYAAECLAGNSGVPRRTEREEASSSFGGRGAAQGVGAAGGPSHRAASAPHRHPSTKFLRHIEHDSEAQYQLGLEYLKGTKYPRSPALAARYLRLAAQRAHAKAEYVMAVVCKTGEAGVLPSARKYVLYLRRASRHGLAIAQVELAGLYMRGLLLPRNVARAKDLLKSAAHVGTRTAGSAGCTSHGAGSVAAATQEGGGSIFATARLSSSGGAFDVWVICSAAFCGCGLGAL